MLTGAMENRLWGHLVGKPNEEEEEEEEEEEPLLFDMHVSNHDVLIVHKRIPDRA